MKAELKWLHSPDVELETFAPELAECFGFLLQAGIGPAGTDAADSFDLQICTPAWLTQRQGREGQPSYCFGTNHLIVSRYDLAQIRAALQWLCERCHGASWSEIAAQLSRHAAWEFDNYRDSSRASPA